VEGRGHHHPPCGFHDWHIQGPKIETGGALLIEVLRKDGIVLKSFEHTPGAWSSKSAFTPAKFSYQADGSGDIRLRISAAGNKTDDRFKGSIDNLAVKEAK